MKIAEVTPLFAWGGRNMLLVKSVTDEGIVGRGESGLSGREHAVTGAIRHFSELRIGEAPCRIGQICQRLYRSQYAEGGRVLTSAISAIDIALQDIKGKALGVPLYDLLGGRQRAKVPLFASTRCEPSEKMIEDAETSIWLRSHHDLAPACSSRIWAVALFACRRWASRTSAARR